MDDGWWMMDDGWWMMMMMMMMDDDDDGWWMMMMDDDDDGWWMMDDGWWMMMMMMMMMMMDDGWWSEEYSSVKIQVHGSKAQRYSTQWRENAWVESRSRWWRHLTWKLTWWHSIFDVTGMIINWENHCQMILFQVSEHFLRISAPCRILLRRWGMWASPLVDPMGDRPLLGIDLMNMNGDDLKLRA